MILHEPQYIKFIEQKGVGKKDVVASSPNSYLSYLRSVSSIINKDISPALLQSQADVDKISQKIKASRAVSTVKKYRSAMHRYVEMVQECKL